MFTGLKCIIVRNCLCTGNLDQLPIVEVRGLTCCNYIADLATFTINAGRGGGLCEAEYNQRRFSGGADVNLLAEIAQAAAV